VDQAQRKALSSSVRHLIWYRE